MSVNLLSNRCEDHEVSMLALHVLQNHMVYINTLTLMLQQIEERSHNGQHRLTI